MKKQVSDLHSQHIYDPVPFRHKTASAFYLEQLICWAAMLTDHLVAISDPGPLPRGCWLILCTLQIPVFPFCPNYSILDGFLLSPDQSYLFHVIWTTSFSMSSASPFSRGSAIIVILFLRREMVAISPQSDGNGSNWQDLRDCALPRTQLGR